MEKDSIYYVQDYEPYRIDGNINPNFNKQTGGYLLDFKQGNNIAVNKYFKELKEVFDNDELIKNKDIYVTCVPSSSRGNVGNGLKKLIGLICKEYSWKNACGWLHRDYDIAKLATGGDRSKNIHKESISLLNQNILKGKSVLLVDDITTTGNSLNGCKEILYENGVDSVYIIALGQTVGYYGEA